MPPFPANRSFERSNQLQARLHDLVPGGAHTYAAGSDQYPEGMAPVLARGRGCRVWDVDGNEYIEYGMGLRAVTPRARLPAGRRGGAPAIADGVQLQSGRPRWSSPRPRTS